MVMKAMNKIVQSEGLENRYSRFRESYRFTDQILYIQG